MAQRFTELSEKHIQFIASQKIFFIGTAAASGSVNVSPKGMDTLRVMGNNRVVWLNVTGSSNETSAHVQQDPRMTIMFCAFEGDPLILRLYGSATLVSDLQVSDLPLTATFNVATLKRAHRIRPSQRRGKPNKTWRVACHGGRARLGSRVGVG